MSIERKYELALFGSCLEMVKDEECEGCNFIDDLRENLGKASADAALAYMIMQNELKKTDYKKLEKIYDTAKPMAEMLKLLLQKDKNENDYQISGE